MGVQLRSNHLWDLEHFQVISQRRKISVLRRIIWMKKNLTGEKLLEGAGSVSHAKANEEYQKYQIQKYTYIQPKGLIIKILF